MVNHRRASRPARPDARRSIIPLTLHHIRRQESHRSYRSCKSEQVEVVAPAAGEDSTYVLFPTVSDTLRYTAHAGKSLYFFGHQYVSDRLLAPSYTRQSIGLVDPAALYLL